MDDFKTPAHLEVFKAVAKYANETIANAYDDLGKVANEVGAENQRARF